MKKKIIFIVTSVLSIACLCGLVYFIKVDSFAFAWVLNFLLMACAAFLSDAMQSRYASPYFLEKKWEQKGKLYEYFGINIYRKLLVWTGWEKLTRKTLPIGNNTEALTKLYQQTKISELNHTVIFMIVLGFNVYVALIFGFSRSLSLLILNILLNLYPIFLQRYNRPRIKRALTLSQVRHQLIN
ncbi:glycosyl-4,4'-diaponeurosporenoate acyltransferase CrtO family protein [Pedobacter deserti]|uniref:glycosyl-4,4'-diaponeurosporenoate acyltransferase CrtO family protein n=1 Tax=Pedobacter deserti TaxID=2817382 RepID=UPI00210D34ED|nr:hypothetical protein [Pedobacter sp. SYSU D00382]